MDDNRLERALRDLPWDATNDRDEAILEDASVAFDDAFVSRPDSSPAPGRSWFPPLLARAAHNRFCQGALAAAMIFAASIVFLVLLPGPSLTLADVQAALAAQKWVHVKYDNGRERWDSLKDGLVYFKSETGPLSVLDHSQGIARAYDPRFHGNYILERTIEPFSWGKTPWEIAVGYLEDYQRKPNSYIDVERHTDNTDGKDLVRFDLYRTTAGQRIMTHQVWADPRTRLPVRSRELLVSAERREQNREWIVGSYDFPETGPADIYDLGVPRDAAIVKEGQPSAPEAQDIVDAGKKALSRYPSRYRAVIWKDVDSNNVDVIYRDGVKVRKENYGTSDNSVNGTASPLPFPATADQVFAWTQTQMPIQVGLFDGQTNYDRSGPYPPSYISPPPSKVHVGKSSQPLLYITNDPYESQWEYVFRLDLQILSRADELPPGCVALRFELGDTRQDFYIDPGRDYVKLREIWWNRQSGVWLKKRDYTLSDFVPLPNGQYYATKMRLLIYYDLDQPTGPKVSESNYNIDVALLAESAFPPDTFNGQKLLEGAALITH